MSDKIIDHLEAKWNELQDACVCDQMAGDAGECSLCQESFIFARAVKGLKRLAVVEAALVAMTKERDGFKLEAECQKRVRLGYADRILKLEAALEPAVVCVKGTLEMFEEAPTSDASISAVKQVLELCEQALKLAD